MTIIDERANAVQSLLRLSDNLNEELGTDPIEDVLGNIYIRTVNDQLRIERGGILQTLKRAWDVLFNRGDSYRIVVADEKTESLHLRDTYNKLKQLHDAIEKISEDDLDAILTKLNVTDIKSTKKQIIDSLPTLDRIIEHVRDQKEAGAKTASLATKIHNEFKNIIINFKGKEIATLERGAEKLEAIAVAQRAAEEADRIDKSLPGKMKVILSAAIKECNIARELAADPIVEESPATLDRAKQLVQALKSSSDTADLAYTQARNLFIEADGLLKEYEAEHAQRLIFREPPEWGGQQTLRDIAKAEAECTIYAANIKSALTTARGQVAKMEAEERFKEELKADFTKGIKLLKDTRDEARRLLERANDPVTAAKAESSTKQHLTEALTILDDLKFRVTNHKEFEPFLREPEQLKDEINRIATEAHTLHEKLLREQARRPRAPLPLPAGPREKGKSSAVDLAVPEWAQKNVDRKTLQSLEGVINRLQNHETSLLTTRSRIQEAPDVQAKKTAERVVGMCLNELSGAVEALQLLLQEPPASSLNQHLRELEGSINTYAQYSSPSYKTLTVELNKLFAAPTAPPAPSVDDIFKQIDGGKSFMEQFHNLELCLNNDLLSVRYKELKSAVREAKSQLDQLYADWQQNPTQAHISRAREFMQAHIAKFKEQGAEYVTTTLKNFLPYFAQVDSGLKNCPDTLPALKVYLESLRAVMPSVARGLLIGSFGFDEMKRTHSNSLAILLLSEKNRKLKETLLAPEVDPSLEAVKQFVIGLVPSSAWLEEARKDPYIEFALQQAHAMAEIPKAALPNTLTVDASLAKHREILQKFGLPLSPEELQGAIAKQKDKILKEQFASIEGGRWRPTIYSESGWFANYHGTLARGSYATTYNELDDLTKKMSQGSITAEQIDTLGQLLTRVNYFLETMSKISPRTAEEIQTRQIAKVSVVYLELEQFVRKIEGYLRSEEALDDKTKPIVATLWKQLDKEVWNQDTIRSAMNEITKIVEANHWHDNWDELVETEEITTQPYQSLVEELSSHISSLQF